MGVGGGDPNPRARRREARDPQAGGLWQASCQRGFVADGHDPRDGHPWERVLRVLATGREEVRNSPLHESRIFSREDAKRTCRFNPRRRGVRGTAPAASSRRSSGWKPLPLSRGASWKVAQRHPAAGPCRAVPAIQPSGLTLSGSLSALGELSIMGGPLAWHGRDQRPDAAAPLPGREAAFHFVGGPHRRGASAVALPALASLPGCLGSLSRGFPVVLSLCSSPTGYKLGRLRLHGRWTRRSRRMSPPESMPRSPIRHDGVLARSLPPLGCLWMERFPPPDARIRGRRQGLTRKLRNLAGEPRFGDFPPPSSLRTSNSMPSPVPEALAASASG